MSSIQNKLSNLTDIPLGLEQGDNVDITTAEKPEKIKSNSLKRFFRTAKNSMTTSKSSINAADAACEMEMKNVPFFQMRFGSFHKNNNAEKEQSNTEPSSSAEALKLKPSTENRSKLQSRVAGYLSTAFKKSSTKKSSTKDNVQLEDKGNPPLSENDKF